MEIYKRILFTKVLGFHDELAYDMVYDMALGNVSHANDDYESNRNFKKYHHKDY